jgi:hypothetical protein
MSTPTPSGMRTSQGHQKGLTKAQKKLLMIDEDSDEMLLSTGNQNVN